MSEARRSTRIAAQPKKEEPTTKVTKPARKASSKKREAGDDKAGEDVVDGPAAKKVCKSCYQPWLSAYVHESALPRLNWLLKVILLTSPRPSLTSKSLKVWETQRFLNRHLRKKVRCIDQFIIY